MGDEFSDTSTDMSSDTSMDTSSDVSSDVGMDTNSDVDTGADVSADEGLDTSSEMDTEADVSVDEGLDTSSDMDTEVDEGADEGLDTGSDIDTETDEELDAGSDVDTETDEGADEGLDTEPDADTGEDVTEDEGLDTGSETDTSTEINEDEGINTDVGTDTEPDVEEDEALDTGADADEENDTNEVPEEEDSENKEVEEDADEVPEEEDSENKEVEEDTDEVPEEEDSENKEVEEDTNEVPEDENGETSETPEQDELDGPEKSNDTDDVANGDDSNLDDEGGNGDIPETPEEDDAEGADGPSEEYTGEIPEEKDENLEADNDVYDDADKVIERDREIVPDKELYNDTEIRDNINDINIDKPQMSDTPIYDTPIFVTGFRSNDVKSEAKVNNNTDIKNSNETSNKKGFKDRIKGIFGGKKKEKPEDAPINVKNDVGEDDPKNFRNYLAGMRDTTPKPDDINYDPNKKPKPMDHGQREIGNDDPKWKDAISDTENANTKINANNINRAETITEKQEIVQPDASQEVNEGIFGGIFLSKEEREAKELQEKINDSNENLKDTQETINQFFEEENIMNYLSNTDRFKQKMERPLSDTVKNMGYQEAEETYNSMSRDEYSRNILGFNNGKKSYIIVEGKDAREIKHTTIHENIHQMSANDVYLGENDIITRRGISIEGKDTQVNEGITEFYAKRAMKDEYQEDNVAYSPNVRRTEQLERIVGKGNLYKAYFENQPGIIINEFEQNFGPSGKEIWEKYSKFCDLAVESNDEYVRTVANQEADKILQKLETLKIVNANKNIH